jgi:hypothetical protein
MEGIETGRGVGTGIGPDFPGMRRRASKSFAGVETVAVADEDSVELAGVSTPSAGAGVAAAAAMGGGVEASNRRRSSAAVNAASAGTD